MLERLLRGELAHAFQRWGSRFALAWALCTALASGSHMGDCPRGQRAHLLTMEAPGVPWWQGSSSGCVAFPCHTRWA